MLRNPIVQNIFLFLGIYFAMNFLKGIGKPLPPVAMVLGGLFAVSIWILRYDRGRAFRLYANPVTGPFLDLVCKITRERVPTGTDAGLPVSSAPSAVGAPSTSGRTAEGAPKDDGFLIRTEADAYAAAEALKAAVIARDDIIDGVLKVLSGKWALRSRAIVPGPRPPLAIFLFSGPPGLGKRTLAAEIGRRIHREGSTLHLDLRQSTGAPGGTSDNGEERRLIEAVKRCPAHTIVVEGVDAAPTRWIEEMKRICETGGLEDPATGSRVDFGKCVFFLLTERAVPAGEDGGSGGEGHDVTVTIRAVREATPLDGVLASQIDAVHAFRLPPIEAQAAILAHMFEGECRKYGKRIEKVDPEVLAREVKAVQESGGFEVAPGRIAKIIGAPLQKAIAEEKECVTIGKRMEGGSRP